MKLVYSFVVVEGNQKTDTRITVDFERLPGDESFEEEDDEEKQEDEEVEE